jgi:hypothetical protein
VNWRTEPADVDLLVDVVLELVSASAARTRSRRLPAS